MTEQTTTDLLTAVRSYIINEDQIGTSTSFVELERALIRGEPLPEQWPQAAELVELRTELAALRKALDDRRTVDGWANTLDEERFYIVSRHIGHGKFTVTLTDMALMDPTDYEEGASGPISEYEFEFIGDNPDEVFAAAAEWVRRQG
jgi:hypothetical protein